MGVAASLFSRIEAAAAPSPQAIALLAPGREPLDYRGVVEQLRATGAQLNGLGFGPGDRLAVGLPDSPELALLMFAAIGCAAAVPLSPRAAEEEIERQLRGTRTRAVVVPAGTDTAARRAATSAGLPVIELHSDPSEPAGRFRLEGKPLAASQFPPSDAALVVHTSGTTGSAKVVPLTQANLLSMMAANCAVLELTPRDRCLGVMPLCHIHGLGAVLCSLLSGGSVVVTPGFTADPFFEWLERFAPTWYTAVPTIHQAILDRAPAHESIVRTIAETRSMRFVRSASAPMPRGVPERLEALFNATYVEASGATEASAYICSNRPARRRIGSVGEPMPDTEVRVIDDIGRPVGPNVEGELVARGPGVFAGYENNPAATSAAFVDGFFRTGDLGRRDDDGYFYITGRIKEQINRAGSKVSPNEVDEVLLKHAAVAHAVTFAIPDDQLGEEVAAAIVLRPKARRESKPDHLEFDIQRHVAAQLADYKVPRRIVIVDQIPAGPSGKIVRVGLAAKLGLVPGGSQPAPREPWVEPATPTEQALAVIWGDAIGRRAGNVNATLHELGVDSLQAVGISLKIEERFGRVVPLATLSGHPTIRAVAALLDSDGWRPEPGAPVLLREGDPSRPTLFVMPGIGGTVYSYYGLARRMPASQRVIGLPLPGADGLEPPMHTLDEIADRFLTLIRREQPSGPYLLSGYSFGGRAAFEVAHRLIDAGERVQLLAMFDTPGPHWPPPMPWRRRASLHAHRLLRKITRKSNGQVVPQTTTTTTMTMPGPALIAPDAPRGGRQRQDALIAACHGAAYHWRPRPIDAQLALFRAGVSVWTNCDVSDPAMGWSHFTTVGVQPFTIPGAHMTILNEPHVAEFAERLAELIESPAPMDRIGMRRAPATP